MNNTMNAGQDKPALTSKLNYSTLSYLQKQKFDYLKRLINDEELTLQLVQLIEPRGKNNFNSVVDKIEALNGAKSTEQRYHDALYDNFNINQLFSSSDIITIVSQVRREAGMPPYSSRWKQNCESDFFSLFIVVEEYEEIDVDGKVKRQFLGYKPVFKLKSED